MYEAIEKASKALVEKSVHMDTEANEAMKFTQAALNLGQLVAVLVDAEDIKKRVH